MKKTLQKLIFLITLFFPAIVYGQSNLVLEKSLKLYNIHTQESVNVIYWKNGIYLKDSLNKLNSFLRDFRTGGITKIDTKLLDTLFNIHQKSGSTNPINIISGYRSPKTNDFLHKTTNGVAKKSFHTLGQAIDIRIPGIPLKKLRDLAKEEKLGGVGYYPKSDFIHIDSGKVRYW